MNQKKNKGITLISLVITITILLMLVGITFVTLTADNGLIINAEKVKKETDEATIEEEINIMLLNARVENNIENIFKDAEKCVKDGNLYEIIYKNKQFLVSSNYEYIAKVEPTYAEE